MTYDPEKKAEYQFRLAAAILIMGLIAYALATQGLRGPALFEVGIFGGVFAILTFVHSIWALWKIRKLSS